jgi:iron complex outermembrane recepter protein
MSNSNGYGRFKKTVLAASIMAIGSSVYAAESSENPGVKDGVEEIVINGIRRNIQSAQETKRNADTVIDSITADELGDFPDKSVAEALMRVPGIMVERFATRTDTGAFSVEPSGIIIRGLPFVRSEFNGRDSFSATSSRGLSWGDVSPELMGGVDIYKNQTAQLIEGGISGLVNLKTRLPFDSDKTVNVVTVAGNYSDLSKSSTPEVSGIHTSRYDTDHGEFGVMANFAYSDVDATSQSSKMARVNRFRDVYAPDSLYFIPQGVSFSDSEYSRQRTGTALALQWQDNEGRFVATLQYNRSQYENTSEGRGIGASWSGLGGGDSLFLEVKEGGTGSGAIVRPAAGTDPFEFSKDGLFSHGTITQNHGWWGANNDQSKLVAANANGQALVETCASLDSWAGCGPNAQVTSTMGANVGTSADISDSKSVTEDFSFNFKWNVTDRVHANFDVQRVNATLDEYRINTGLNTWANAEVDLRSELNKVTLYTPTNINLLDAGNGIFGNPNSYYPTSMLEFLGDNHGDEFAAKADVVYDLDSGFVERVKVGVRYADRDQQVNQASNWQAMSTSWNNNAGWFNIDSPAHTGVYDGKPYTFNGYKDAWVAEEWKSTYGSVNIADGNKLFIFPNTATMRDWKNTMSKTATGQPVNGYTPICSNIDTRSAEVDGTCFRPNEALNVTEVSNAFYVQLDFGGADLTLFDRPITGNIGARYVETEITSVGGEQFPEYDLEDRPCEPTRARDPNAPPPPVPQTVTCYLQGDELTFMNNGGILGASKATHHNLLPSLNIKYDVTDKFVTRLALSRAMSRPDIGSLRNYIKVESNLPSVDDATGSLWVKDANGTITGANVVYTSNAANPFLKPTIADQADVSFEYYSGPNSASFAVFAKSFDDYIQTGTYTRQMTNNGVTRDVVINGPINGDGAKVQGFEVQGTHLFDYLPGIWRGLGVQANYTYVENKGIKNTGVNSSSQNGSSGSSGASDRVQVDQLEGMSKDAYNFSVFYERNNLSTRLSYNWRSEYLVTVQDCCIGTPVWQDAYGQLDASVRYRINDMFELSLSGSNLTDQKAVLRQQVENSDDGGKTLKYSINQSDIRYTLGLRMQF